MVSKRMFSLVRTVVGCIAVHFGEFEDNIVFTQFCTNSKRSDLSSFALSCMGAVPELQGSVKGDGISLKICHSWPY